MTDKISGPHPLLLLNGRFFKNVPLRFGIPEVLVLKSIM